MAFIALAWHYITWHYMALAFSDNRLRLDPTKKLFHDR